MLWNRPKPLHDGVNLVLGTGAEIVELYSHASLFALRRHTSAPSHFGLYVDWVVTPRYQKLQAQPGSWFKWFWSCYEHSTITDVISKVCKKTVCSVIIYPNDC